MFGLTHYEILRAERFGSRELEEETARCPHCGRLIDLGYDDAFLDGNDRAFCSREHYLKYYSIGGKR